MYSGIEFQIEVPEKNETSYEINPYLPIQAEKKKNYEQVSKGCPQHIQLYSSY